MAGGGSVANPLRSADTEATMDALERLGVRLDGDDPVRVEGTLAPADEPLDCRNSGTTLRLMTGVAATLAGRTTLDGDASLRRRPVGPLVEALGELGCVATDDDGTPPVTVTGPLVGGRCRVPGDTSSQFVSALILAGTRSREGVTITIEGDLVSRPYVDLTIDAVERVGGTVERTDAGYRVPPADLAPAELVVEGDWSSAAFPLALGALGGPVTVEGLDPDSAQGDRSILDHLRTFGADVETHDDGATVEGGDLHGAEIDLRDTPDLFPALAAVACHAEGKSVLSGAGHLRAKESDRIAAMVDGIEALGGDADARDDGAVVHGTGLEGGTADTRDDHRVLMALCVAATRADEPVTLSEGESFTVSYPSFLSDLSELGARWTR